MTTVAELSLRPYQHRTVKLAHDAIRAGARHPLVVSPTGSGKRLMAVWWSEKAATQEKEVLFVTDRRLLIEQAAEEFHRHGIPVGIIMEGYEEDRQPRIQLASIQTLEARYLGTIRESELPPADMILIDEAHKSIQAYKALLAHYDQAYAFLLTATPVGPSGTSLIQAGYADALTEGVKNSELIRAGFLLKTTVIAPSEPDIDGIKIRNSEEYGEVALGRRVQEVTCFADVFNEWAPFADRKTIVFAPGIAYCNGLMGGPGIPGDSFYSRGIRAAVLTSKVKAKDRERLIEEFRHGDLKVLISVDVLREGADFPMASCAIDLQPNAQFRTYWQKVGRIKRPHEGQDNAVLIDMAGNYWRFPHPDEDPDWDEVTGETTTQDVIERNILKGKAERSIRCPKCDLVRKFGPKCPACGYVAEERELVRKIRMGNGKLREVPIKEKRKKEKTEADRRRDRWKSFLFVGLKSGMTLQQCAGIHRKKHGEWPRHVPCLPPDGSAQWRMRVNQLYTPQEIMKAFARAAQ